MTVGCISNITKPVLQTSAGHVAVSDATRSTTLTGGSWKNVAEEWPHMVSGLLGPADAQTLRRGRLGAERRDLATARGDPAAAIPPALCAARIGVASPGAAAGAAVGGATGAAGAAMDTGGAGVAAMKAAGGADGAAVQNVALPNAELVMALHPPGAASLGDATLPEIMIGAHEDEDEVPVFGFDSGEDAASSSCGSSCHGEASEYVLQTGLGTEYNQVFGAMSIEDAVTDVFCCPVR